MAYNVAELKEARRRANLPESLKGLTLKLSLGKRKPVRGTFLVTAELKTQLGLNQIDAGPEEADKQTFVSKKNIKIEGAISNPQTTKYAGLPNAQIWLQQAT